MLRKIRLFLFSCLVLVFVVPSMSWADDDPLAQWAPQFDYSKNNEARPPPTASTPSLPRAGESTTVSVRGRDAATIHDQIWTKDYPAMLQRAKDVVGLDPNDSNYQDTLASLYFLHNDYKDAVDSQNLALEKARKAAVAEETIKALEKKLNLYRQFAGE